MVPNDKITLNADQLVSFNKMLDAFEDNDDVQDIYHNVDLPEEEDED
jgi:transcriptional/translational regulatory protein YebC/TACO1